MGMMNHCCDKRRRGREGITGIEKIEHGDGKDGRIDKKGMEGRQF